MSAEHVHESGRHWKHLMMTLISALDMEHCPVTTALVHQANSAVGHEDAELDS